MRMRKGFVAVALLTAALLGAAVFWRMRPSAPAQVAAPVQQERASTAETATTRAAITAAPSPPAASDPAMSEHQARMDFHNRVRTFFAQAPALSVDEKVAQARELDGEIERYREAGELSAPEAFTLRLALIRESAPEAEQQARIERLRDEYRARSASVSAAPSDPMFEVYKAREREIVAQVQAMEEIPDGLTRDEYLRRALQREREVLMGN